MKDISALILELKEIKALVTTPALVYAIDRLEEEAWELVDVGEVEDSEVRANLREQLSGLMKVADKMTTTQKTKMKQYLKTHRPRQKRIVCCSKPELRPVKGGKKFWFSICSFKFLSGPSKGQTKSLMRIVGRIPNKRPSAVIVNGKRARIC